MMKFKNLVRLFAIAVVVLFISGCSVTSKTSVYGHGNQDIFVYVDRDSTALGFILADSVGRTNYMYSFAVAAQYTLDHGYKYFSIYEPKQFIEQLKDRNATNVQEAYDACKSGSGSFQTGLTFTTFYDSVTNKLRSNSWNTDNIKYSNNCDSILYLYKEPTYKGTTVHRAVRYRIEMHNKNRHDNITFNAQDVLNSELIRELNKDYFVNGKD